MTALEKRTDTLEKTETADLHAIEALEKRVKDIEQQLGMQPPAITAIVD